MFESLKKPTDLFDMPLSEAKKVINKTFFHRAKWDEVSLEDLSEMTLKEIFAHRFILEFKLDDEDKCYFCSDKNDYYTLKEKYSKSIVVHPEHIIKFFKVIFQEDCTSEINMLIKVLKLRKTLEWTVLEIKDLRKK